MCLNLNRTDQKFFNRKIDPNIVYTSLIETFLTFRHMDEPKTGQTRVGRLRPGKSVKNDWNNLI